MPRSLRDLLAGIDKALEADPARREASGRAQSAAERLAGQMPLVHRTGWPGQRRPWTAVFTAGRLEASAACTELEERLGYTLAVYLFVGCGAYPKGNVALLFEQGLARAGHVTFTPFDTGALPDKLTPMAATLRVGWDEAAKLRVLEEHLGHGEDLHSFAGPYVAAHFRDPHAYVTCGQHEPPDFTAVHGLASDRGDRRDWTIEVQAHADVPVPPDPSACLVLLDDKDLRRELPSSYLRSCRIVRQDEDEGPSFTEAIAAEVLRRIEGESA
jgi:hypothetical protein